MLTFRARIGRTRGIPPRSAQRKVLIGTSCKQWLELPRIEHTYRPESCRRRNATGWVPWPFVRPRIPLTVSTTDIGKGQRTCSKHMVSYIKHCRVAFFQWEDSENANKQPTKPSGKLVRVVCHYSSLSSISYRGEHIWLYVRDWTLMLFR